MDITYLHQYFNTPNMSGGTRSFEMAKRLVAQGHQVNMITSWRGEGRGTDWFETMESGIRVHWLPVAYSNHMGFLQRIRAFFHFAWRSAGKAAAIQADVIFATSTPLTIALPAVYASKRQKAPMVFEVRDLWPEMPIAMGALKSPMLQKAAMWLERWAYRNAAAVVALSPGMKAGVVKAGYAPARVAVIPNSSDNTEFAYNDQAAKAFRESRPWLGDKPLLVYAGTFGRVNGVGYAVELAKELKVLNSDVLILLVGDGAERAQVFKQADVAGVLNTNLFFESMLPKKEMPALFSAATMASNLVTDLPQARANSANKFFDTLAAGKPILLNHGGWMHDLVNQYKCGLAMWHQPMPEVARLVDSAMKDPDWLMQAGCAAAHLATHYFDRDVLALQLEQVLLAAKDGRTQAIETFAPGIYE